MVLLEDYGGVRQQQEVGWGKVGFVMENFVYRIWIVFYWEQGVMEGYRQRSDMVSLLMVVLFRVDLIEQRVVKWGVEVKFWGNMIRIRVRVGVGGEGEEGMDLRNVGEIKLEIRSDFLQEELSVGEWEQISFGVFLVGVENIEGGGVGFRDSVILVLVMLRLRCVLGFS